MEYLSPDFQSMMSAHSSGVVRGVIVTLQGTESNGCVDSSGAVYDFVSRYFAPWVGIPEDPVTGKFLDRKIYIFAFLRCMVFTWSYKRKRA